MERESFIFYRDWWLAIKKLPQKERLDIFDAIAQYGLTGVEPKKTTIYTDVAMAFIKPQIDRDLSKYQNRCEANRLNAKKGGRPSTHTDNDIDISPTTFEEKRTQDPIDIIKETIDG